MTVAATANFAEVITNVISSSLCVGSSITMRSGFISKLIQDIRFLNISYSSQVEGILQTSRSRFLNLSIPAQIDHNLISKGIPMIYTKYGFKPSFLSNFWKRLIILLCVFALWIICFGLYYCLRRHNKSYTKVVRIVFKKLAQAALNFLIVQIYGEFSYVVFFTALEISSVSFRSTWSGVSFGCSLIFMTLGLCLLGLHCTFLTKHRRLKSKVSTDSSQLIETLATKYQWLEVLYKDFSDRSLFKYGFMFILAARNITVSVLITTMLSFPLVEAILLVCCSLLMCAYLLFNNPFHTRYEQFSQIFLELCVLAVYICVLILAVLDSQSKYTSNHRAQAELAIIIVNIILKYGCILLMSLKMLQIALNAYKNNSNKKERKVHAVADKFILNESNNSGAQIKPNDGDSFINTSLAGHNTTNVDISMIKNYLHEPKREQLDKPIISQSPCNITKTSPNGIRNELFNTISFTHNKDDKPTPDSAQAPQNILRPKQKSPSSQRSYLGTQTANLPSQHNIEYNHNNEEQIIGVNYNRHGQTKSLKPTLDRGRITKGVNDPKRSIFRGVQKMKEHIVHSLQANKIPLELNSNPTFSCNFHLPTKVEKQSTEINLEEFDRSRSPTACPKKSSDIANVYINSGITRESNIFTHSTQEYQDEIKKRAAIATKSFLQLYYENKEQILQKDLNKNQKDQPSSFSSSQQKEINNKNDYNHLIPRRRKQGMEDIKASQIN